MSSLLARFAENAFWMARYVERIENVARILDVNETFARDSHGSQTWLPILQLHSDEKAFFELYDRADAASVVRFYMIDRRNSNSIASSLYFARENARSLRHLISLELWQQLNVFWNWVQGLRVRDLNLNNLSRLCSQIKEGCQLHYGAAHKTMYRDQVWLFYQLGAHIERCDQTTRLVDIKYHALLPRPEDVGSAVDVSQWNAVLRSAAAYHGYRRVHPQKMTPGAVASFILFDPHLPRSITFCVGEIDDLLEELLQEPELKRTDFPKESIAQLKDFCGRDPKLVLSGGLHEFLDQVQLALIALNQNIDETFFPQQAASD